MLTLIALLSHVANPVQVAAPTPSQCGLAFIASGGAVPPLLLTAHVAYMTMRAAKDSPGGKPFLDRVNELSDQSGKTVAPTAEAARALAPVCDKYFPLARANGTAKLPADPFQRDIMCLGILGMLKGAAGGIEEETGDSEPLDAIDAAFEPLAQRLTDPVLAAHNIKTDEAMTAMMGEQLKASLMLGNPIVVGRACGATGL